MAHVYKLEEVCDKVRQQVENDLMKKFDTRFDELKEIIQLHMSTPTPSIPQDVSPNPVPISNSHPHQRPGSNNKKKKHDVKMHAISGYNLFSKNKRSEICSILKTYAEKCKRDGKDVFTFDGIEVPINSIRGKATSIISKQWKLLKETNSDEFKKYNDQAKKLTIEKRARILEARGEEEEIIEYDVDDIALSDYE